MSVETVAAVDEEAARHERSLRREARRRLASETTPRVLCECGCGTAILRWTQEGKFKARWAPGHRPTSQTRGDRPGVLPMAWGEALGQFPRFSQTPGCAGEDPDLFWDMKDPSGVAKAKSICAACPVREECEDWAVEKYETLGIWGGMTPAERRPDPGEAAPSEPKTHCRNNHEYTLENTAYTKGGYRRCRKCVKTRAKRLGEAS